MPGVGGEEAPTVRLSEEERSAVIERFAGLETAGAILSENGFEEDEVRERLIGAARSKIDLIRQEKKGRLYRAFMGEVAEFEKGIEMLKGGDETFIGELRTLFPGEVQPTSESVQVRKTLLLWAQIGSLFRRGR